MNQMLIILPFIIVLLHPILSKDIDYYEKNRTLVQITDRDFLVKEINMTYLNNKDFENPFKSISKIFYLKNDPLLIDTLIKYMKISSHMIILCDDAQFLRDHYKGLKNIILPSGVIVPNTTLFQQEIMINFYNSQSESMFMYNASDFKDLEPYTIQNEDSNYFIRMFYEIELYFIPLIYLKTVSIICCLISIGIVAAWILYLRFGPPVQLNDIHKVIIFLPYINVILSTLLIFQMFMSTGQKSMSFSDSRIYVETAMVTVRAIFRTILWFLIMFIASGWQITSQEITREKLKTYIKVYVFIYVAVCIDQIIDAFTGPVWSIFFPSELKNICFYLLMAIGIGYEGIKTIKLLQQKLHYARALSPEFMPSLFLKKNMMIIHVGFGISYFIVYCILLALHKTVLLEYNVSDFLLMNYHIMDVVYIIMYLVLYRPKKLPLYYNVDFGNEEMMDLGNIYSAKIPNIMDLANEQHRTLLTLNDISQITKPSYNNENPMPIVVIHPVILNDDDHNKKTVNIIIDKVAVGMVA